jgi:hypothetical protein
MKRLLYLAISGLVASMMFAPAALAQEPDRAPFCQELDARIAAGVGDNPLTTAELLSCGISPEVISPCEGVPDPSCAANNPPGISFGGPNGATANDTEKCAALPEGSPESIACYEELVARLTGTTQTTAPTTAPAITEMPATGGPSLLLPAGLLLASGLIGLGLMRRK